MRGKDNDDLTICTNVWFATKKLWRDKLGRSSSELTRDALIEIKR